MDIGSLVTSLVGLGTKIGTAIPGLKKPKNINTAQAVARSAGSQFGGAVGAAQAGQGASRGLALREGLRAGTAAVGETSRAIAGAAANDVAMNQANKDNRNQRIAQFGTDLAKGLGDMAGMQVQPKGADSISNPERPQVDVNPETGFGTPQDDPGTGGGLDAVQKGLDDQDAMDQQQLIDDAQSGLEQLQQQRQEVFPDGGPAATFKVDPATQLIESRSPGVAPEIEQHLADKLQMKELMLSEAERLGIGVETILARVNRRLQLKPGQSKGNPMGVSLGDYTKGNE